MASKDRNMTATSNIRDLKFWCVSVLGVGFALLCWCGFVSHPELFREGVNRALRLYNFLMLLGFSWPLLWLSLPPPSLGAAWALHRNMMLINASITSPLEPGLPPAVWCHPPLTHSDTHIHFTDVSREASRCWEEKLAKATVRLCGTAKNEKAKSLAPAPFSND